MASPAWHPPEPQRKAVRAPEADPVAIRACLPPDVVEFFDAEWETVLEAAKQSKDLAGMRDLPLKWRAFAVEELRNPGAYFRLLAAAAEAQRTGQAPDGSISGSEMRRRVEARLAEVASTDG